MNTRQPPEESKKLKALKKKLSALQALEQGTAPLPPPKQLVASSLDTWQNYPSAVRDQLHTNYSVIKQKQAQVAELQESLANCTNSPEIPEKVTQRLNDAQLAVQRAFEKRYEKQAATVCGMYDAEIHELTGKLTDLQQQLQILKLARHSK